MTNEQFLAQRVIELEKENRDLRATVRFLVDLERGRQIVETASRFQTEEAEVH